MITDKKSYSRNDSINEATSSDAAVAKKCKRISISQETNITKKAKTLFMTQNWRKELCRCDDCIKLYDDQNVSFLIDEEDTVHHYESQAKNEGTLFAL